MQAKLLSHRIGPKSQRPREYIIQVPGVESAAEASRLIGRKVIWHRSKAKRTVGKVVGAHGGRGCVRARFRRGLPGTAYGTEVTIV